jgi:hypothetical protein
LAQSEALRFAAMQIEPFHLNRKTTFWASPPISNSQGDSVGEGLVSLRMGATTQQLRTQRVEKLSEVVSAVRCTAARVCRLP